MFANEAKGDIWFQNRTQIKEEIPFFAINGLELLVKAEFLC